MRTVADVIAALPSPDLAELPAPRYDRREPGGRPLNIGLAVASMANHHTDEGIQLFRGLEHAGYQLWGAGFPPRNEVDVRRMAAFDGGPSVVILQDKREWEGRTAGPGFDDRERFRNVGAMASDHRLFRGTVLKDAHQNPEYHRDSAAEVGAHFWVTYYHPRIVKHLAPYVRERHLVRTWHSLDRDAVPPFSTAGRLPRALLSGAVSGAYPLRRRLLESRATLDNLDWLPHPGYHRRGCGTPEYLHKLSGYRVAVCTSSVYGYSLRKLVEATAAGCVVITDLPADDPMPQIDGNLVRVRPDVPVGKLGDLIDKCVETYDPRRQREFANLALEYYDFRVRGLGLARDVEVLRRDYPCS